MNKYRFNPEAKIAFTLRLPRVILLYPLFDALLGAILLPMMIANQNIPGVIAVGVIFIAPMLIVSFHYAVYCVIFDSEGFTFRSAFGIKHNHDYKDIIDIIPGNRYCKIIVEGKNIYVNAKSNHCHYFQEYADKKRDITKEKYSDESIDTHFPKIKGDRLYLIIGIICSLLSSFAIYFSWISSQASASIIFGVFVLMGIILIIEYFKTGTYINEYEIIDIDGLHKPTHYPFEKLIAVTILTNDDPRIPMAGGDILLCFDIKDCKVISVESGDLCYNDFKKWLHNEYPNKFMSREEFDKLSMPEMVATEKNDKEQKEAWAKQKNIFKGNIYYPTTAASFRNLIIIISLVFIAIHLFLPDKVTENDLIDKEVTFYQGGYATGNPIEFLFSEEYFDLRTNDDANDYWISHFSTYGKNQDLLLNEINHQVIFYLKVESCDSGYAIAEMKDQYGNVFYTINDINKARRTDDFSHIRVFATVIILAIGLYFLFVIIVRRLERMPKIIVQFILNFEEPSEKLLEALPKGYYYPKKTKSLWKR